MLESKSKKDSKTTKEVKVKKATKAEVTCIKALFLEHYKDAKTS